VVAWTLSSVGKDLTCGRYQVHLSTRERDILGRRKDMQGPRQITLGNELRDYFGKAALYLLSRERSHHRSRNRTSINTYYILIMSSLLTKATKHLPMYFYTLIYFVNIIHYVTIYCYTMSKSTQIHIISHHYRFYYMNFYITSRKFCFPYLCGILLAQHYYTSH